MKLNGDLAVLQKIVDGALASLEASRQRIDDLNVYPVPDGDTGTNLTMTVRAVAEAVEQHVGREPAVARPRRRARRAHGRARQLRRDLLPDRARRRRRARRDRPAAHRRDRRRARAARRLRRRLPRGAPAGRGNDAVRHPRARRGGGGARAQEGSALGDLLVELVRRGEIAVARTPEQLQVLRDAGVVDAGGAGLLELVRGVAATVSGEPLPPPQPRE